MSESNNVKFVENKGKWMWKRYDEQGSVTFRSPEFDTERGAREDYEANGDNESTQSSEGQAENTQGSAETTGPENAPEAGASAPEGEMNAGSVSNGESANL